MLAERVRPGEVVGLDISEPMLARARERGKDVENLHFECADAQTFAFSEAAYDAVFSRFGVDVLLRSRSGVRAICGRALRPDGKLGFVCWRGARENPSFTVPLEAALPFLPEPPKPLDPSAPGPFAFADQDKIAGILERAGYGDVEITPHDRELIYGGGRDIEGAVDLALANWSARSRTCHTYRSHAREGARCSPRRLHSLSRAVRRRVSGSDVDRDRAATAVAERETWTPARERIEESRRALEPVCPCATRESLQNLASSHARNRPPRQARARRWRGR